MSDRFTFNSAGQVHELELAMDRVGGWGAALVKVLCMGNNLGLVRDVLLGHAEIRLVSHVINYDAIPFVPDGYKVRPEDQLSGAVRGQLVWDPAKVQLFLSDRQKVGTISGHELRKELTDKPVLNANVLDYLLAHTGSIPEEWKQDEQGRTRYIFFWGTIYRDSDGDPCVRSLYWCDGRWQWGWYWLEFVWGVQNPAALLASF
jgi:hypothetical protein